MHAICSYLCMFLQRVHFGLMLLDANFLVPFRPYTPTHHRGYIHSLRKSEVDERMTEFVQGPGRCYFYQNPSFASGVHEQTEAQQVAPAATRDNYVPQEFYVMPCPPGSAQPTTSILATSVLSSFGLGPPMPCSSLLLAPTAVLSAPLRTLDAPDLAPMTRLTLCLKLCWRHQWLWEALHCQTQVVFRREKAQGSQNTAL